MALKMMINKQMAEAPKQAAEPPHETAEAPKETEAAEAPKKKEWIFPSEDNYPVENSVLKVGHFPFIKRTWVLRPDALTSEWLAAVEKWAETDDVTILNEILAAKKE